MKQLKTVVHLGFSFSVLLLHHIFTAEEELTDSCIHCRNVFIPDGYHSTCIFSKGSSCTHSINWCG